jgi:hypothetical protein
MWFTFVTARLFIFLRFQPRLAATLWRAISVVNSPIRRAGLAPACRPASLAQASLFSVERLMAGTSLAKCVPAFSGAASGFAAQIQCRQDQGWLGK